MFDSFVSFLSEGIGLFLFGAFLGTLAPSVTDPFHFWLQTELYKHKPGRISYIVIQIFDWYLLDSLWFLFLILLAFFLKINNYSTLEIISRVGVAIGLSISVGVISLFVIHRRK